MIERALNLLERAVVAYETYVSVVSRPPQILAPEPCACPQEGAAAANPPEPSPRFQMDTTEPDTQPPAKDYDPEDRESVVAACEQRGIEVVPRTRTSTLVGLLEEFDAKHTDTPAEADSEPEAPAGEAAEATEAPAGDPDDPFNADAPTPTGPTIDDTRAALRALLDSYTDKAEGSAAVTELIHKHAGVNKIVMVPQSKFAAIIAEAHQMLEE